MIFLLLEQSKLRARWRVRRRVGASLFVVGAAALGVAVLFFRGRAALEPAGALLSICTVADILLWPHHGWQRNVARGALLALAAWMMARPPALDGLLDYALGGAFAVSGIVRMLAAAREGPRYWRAYLTHGAFACVLGIALMMFHMAGYAAPALAAVSVEILLTAWGYARLASLGRRWAAAESGLPDQDYDSHGGYHRRPITPGGARS